MSRAIDRLPVPQPPRSVVRKTQKKGAHDRRLLRENSGALVDSTSLIGAEDVLSSVGGVHSTAPVMWTMTPGAHARALRIL